MGLPYFFQPQYALVSGLFLDLIEKIIVLYMHMLLLLLLFLLLSCSDSIVGWNLGRGGCTGAVLGFLFKSVTFGSMFTDVADKKIF